MFSCEEFEIYDRWFCKSQPLTPYECQVGRRVEQYLQRPIALGRRELYGDAMTAAADALLLTEALAIGAAFTRADEIYDLTKGAIDAHWRTAAFEGCKLKQRGALTLVTDEDGSQVFLFAELLADLESETWEIACERGRFLEAGGAAVAQARLDYLRACRHFGPDDHSIKGMDAHDLVAEAVQRRLLDWQDASWWWPWRFPERLPAGALNDVSEDPFVARDADA